MLDAHYWAEYNSYDGSMDKSERTEEYLKAQKNVTNDTARNLVPITGVIFSLLTSIIVLIVGLIGTYFKLKRNKLKAIHNMR